MILQAFWNITGTLVIWTEYNLSISLQLPTWDAAGIQMCYSIIRFEGVCMLYIASLSIMYLTSQPRQKSKRFINRNCIYFSSLNGFSFLTLFLNTCMQFSGLASSRLWILCSEDKRGKVIQQSSCHGLMQQNCSGKPRVMVADWWASATGQESLPRFFQAKSFHL